MNKNLAHKVYNVLVEQGGADGKMRDVFVEYCTTDSDMHKEWRFGGKLGFGGKYYPRDNKVDCYLENYSDITIALIKEMNQALANLTEVKE